MIRKYREFYINKVDDRIECTRGGDVFTIRYMGQKGILTKPEDNVIPPDEEICKKIDNYILKNNN